MEHTLFINTCPREGSRTLELARHLLDKLDGTAEELALFEENLLPLNGKTLALRDKMIAQGNFDHPIFKYARQFANADTVVIAAPFWDLSFPSALKIWLEYVMALSVTFHYDEKACRKGSVKPNGFSMFPPPEARFCLPIWALTMWMLWQKIIFPLKKPPCFPPKIWM